MLDTVKTSGSEIQLVGSLNSTADTTFRIEFFASAVADASGYGEGERYLGFVEVTTDGSGKAVLPEELSFAVAAGEYVTATATDPNGNTSEFSASVEAAAADSTPPFQVYNTGSTVAEGGTDTLASTELHFDDAVQPASSVTFTVTGDLANGQLELTTNPGVAVTSFSQDDVDSNRVVYVHDGSETSSDSFSFNVDDGQGNTLGGQSFAIAVTPVNDDPTNAGSLPADVAVTRRRQQPRRPVGYRHQRRRRRESVAHGDAEHQYRRAIVYRLRHRRRSFREAARVS